jgi:hypothetical protein
MVDCRVRVSSEPERFRRSGPHEVCGLGAGYLV